MDDDDDEDDGRERVRFHWNAGQIRIRAQCRRFAKPVNNLAFGRQFMMASRTKHAQATSVSKQYRKHP